METYYYFRLKNGSPYSIKETHIPINLDAMGLFYKQFTQEQFDFYLEHPTASVQEVWNCQLTPPYVPPTPTEPDLQQYITQKVKDLKNACYASVSITTLEYAAAEDKVNNITADSYYSLIQANQVLSDFRSQAKKALTVYNTYKSQIEAAITIESVDTIYNTAISQL